MKNFLSIGFLLLILLYNAGYYAFYLTVNEQHENLWEARVENNRLDPGMIQTRSIPITFAYQADQEKFQPVLEVFEMDGKVYRVLQQRYAKDTLHIVFVNDQTDKHLKNSLRDWVSTLTQKPTSSKSSSVWEGFEKNYITRQLEFTFIEKPDIVQVYRTFISFEFIQPYLETSTPPPKA
ncbi:MAG TPA: hypothetical protein VI583_14165 [Cyclobacteriaceae bacterium]|nr:hypothetical protein [Cyclobacteriaceae bacterium]